jgi:lambda family phage tail tape measure protein
MPISKADVQIILSAKDQASGVVKQFGSNAEKALRDIETSASRFNTTFDKLKQNWLGLAATAYAAKETMATSWNMIKAGADYEEQSGILDNLSQKYKTTANDIVESMRQASDGLIADADLMQVALGGIAKGLKPEQLTELASAAALLGDTAGKTATEALQDLTEALETGRTKGLKNYLGTTLDLKDSFGDLESKMTAVEKANAMYAITMLEYSKAQAQQKSEVDQAADGVERLEAKWKNLGTTISRGMKWFAVSAADWASGGWLSMEEYARRSADKQAAGDKSKNAQLKVNQYQAEIDRLKKLLLNREDPKGGGGKGGGTGNKDGKSEAKKAAEDRIKRGQELILSLTKERDLIRAVTEEERVRWELSQGKGKDLAEKYKQEAIAIARQIDAQNAKKRADEESAAKTAAIETEISELKKQSDMFGMTESAARLYEMSLKGATAEQLKSADTLMADIELKRQLQQVLEGIRTPQDEYNQQVSLLDVLMQKGMLTTEQYALALQKAKENMENADSDNIFSLERLGEGIQQWSSNSIDAVVNFATTGKGQFKDFVTSALADLAKLAAQEAKMGLIKLGISLVGSYFGGGTVTGTAYNAGVAANFTGGGLGFHKGGLATEPTFIRVGLNPRIFDMAPRYHSGIGPGETAAIIDKKEGIFTEGQMKALGLMANAGITKEKAPSPQNIRIVNVLDPGIVENWASSAAGERVIMNVIRRNQ